MERFRNTFAPARFLRHVSLAWLAALTLVFALGSGLANAQLTTGNIAGTINDPSGAAVPGAEVTARSTETGLTRTTTAGPNGRYEISNLPVGEYEVSASATGFQKSVRSGIVLTVGRNAVVDHQLQVGNVAEEVTVTGEVSLVETTSATVSQLVTAQTVENMPLKGRDLTQLALLQPGVMKMPAGTGAFSGLGDKITVAGARGNQNLYLMDGVSNSDLSGNPQGASGAYLGADSVKEYQIITNNYSAEYQSAAGAIVSAVTKSGTNSLHGSGFWTTRNSRLDSNSWANNRVGAGKRDFSRNQYGGSLGGPIKKDKFFFFGSYEGFRERNKDTDTLNTWTAAVRQGILPATETGAGTTVPIDPFIRQYLDLWPVAGSAYKYAGGATPTFVSAIGNGTEQISVEGADQRPINDDSVTAKFDYQFARQKIGLLTGSFLWDDSDAINANTMSTVGRIAPADNAGLISKKYTIGSKLVSVWTNSLVNEFNFGYSFSQAAQDLPNTDQDFSSLASLGGRKYLAEINPPNGAANIGWRVLGSIYDQKAYQVKDGASWTHGNHSMRLGTELKWFRYKQVSCSRGCNGVWGWPNLSSFLQNQPLQVEIFQPGHDNPDRLMRQLLFGGYFQDNWQLSSSLTLNLGLRYEFTSVPSDDNGLIAALINFNDPAVTATAKVKADPRYKNDRLMPGTIDKFFENPTLKSFSPRVGFAWAPGDKKLSIRGGAGIFYEYPMLFNIRTVLQESPPFVLTGTVDTTSPQYAAFRNGGGAPLQMRPGIGSVPAFVGLLGSTPNIRAMEYNEKNVSIYRWSLTVQQELRTGTVVSAGYTGSRGVHLWQQSAANINRWIGWPNDPSGLKTFPIATANRAAQCPAAAANLPACAAPFAGPYSTNFGIDMRIQSPNAYSFFHGLAVGVQQRMKAGLQLQVAYNFSKSTDNGSGVTSNGENFAQGQRGVWYWDQQMKRGLSQFDQRQTLTTNFTWELPGQHMGGAAGALLGGWQASGIITALDGHPLSLFNSTTFQNNAIGQSGEQNRGNLVPGGNNNAVKGGAYSYYDPTQMVPSFCSNFGTVVNGAPYAGKSADQIRAYVQNQIATRGAIAPACAPGDPEYNPGHFGNLGRNTLSSPGNFTVDFSVQKTFKVREGHSAEFRAEFFNFFNRVNLSDAIAAEYDTQGRPNAAFWTSPTGGQITNAALPRTIQLGLKYKF